MRKRKPDVNSSGHEKLTVSKTINAEGYIYIYVSNESTLNVNVWFDDLKITHRSPNMVVQANDYYPFGLTIKPSDFQREGEMENNFLYQGQELQDDLDLGWYSFKWRNHDPAIGRFFNIDPLADKFVHNSPYAFSENKVTNHIELEGLEAVFAQAEFRLSGPLLGAVGLTTSHALGVAADLKGNIGVYYSGSLGLQVGAGGTAGLSVGVNANTEDIFGLEGWGVSAGAFIDWQSSNQFTGLTTGNYTIWVNDDAITLCRDSQIFSVNSAAYTFDYTGAVTDESISGAADGQIDITVTGTGGQFTYSDDGGQNFQGSNIFADLAPGDYSIVVKDDSNNEMGKIFTVEPGQVIFQESSFSENPIPFTRPETGNSSEDNYQIYLDVRVEDVAASGIYASKLITAKPPESDGFARFNLRPAFRGIFAQDPPAMNEGNIVQLTDRIKLYKIYYGDLYDDKTVPDSLTGTNPYLVLKGGVSKRAYPTLNYLTAYLAANKKFLTWAPIEKEVDYGQEDYLNFYLYDTDLSEVNLIVKAYFDDDTTEEDTIDTLSGLAYGNLVQIPAGPLNSGAIAIDPAKNLVKYELWLTDQLDAVISEVRTYIITPYKHPRTRYYLFSNSLGGYEVLRTIGFSERSAKIEHTISEKLLPTGYDANDGQFGNGHSRKQNSTKVSTGFYSGVLSKEWLEYMQEVALSRKVFDITNGERIPMINATKGVTVERNEDNKRLCQARFFGGL